MYLYAEYRTDGTIVAAASDRLYPDKEIDFYIEIEDTDIPYFGTGDYFLTEDKIVTDRGHEVTELSSTFKASFFKRQLRELDKVITRPMEDLLLSQSKVDPEFRITANIQTAIDEKQKLRELYNRTK